MHNYVDHPNQTKFVKITFAPNNCAIRLVNINWSSGGRSFDGSSGGGFDLGLKEADDSTYTLPILEKITVRLVIVFLVVLTSYDTSWDKSKCPPEDKM